MEYNRKLILENGEEYYGYAFGEVVDRVCEIVFNTSMVGYQEILSDPSYTYQAVVMTYPLIGNYGMADDDYETLIPTIGGLIVREYNDLPSNFRSAATLSEVMKKYKIPGVYGIDTRKLTRSIRDLGSRKVLLTSADTTMEEGLHILKESSIPTDAVSKVSSKEIKKYPVANERCHVVAIEVAGRFGIGADRAINYECDSKGTALNYQVLSDTVSAVRRSKSRAEMDKAVFACCEPIREDYKKRHKDRK